VSARVFIGLPVRNGARFIGSTLQSILSQSYANWELLISDNASTDSTVSICERLAKQDRRISISKHPYDIGAESNFRFVLGEARGDLFVWVAADDTWHPEFLNACVSALEHWPGRGMAFTGIENVDSEGATLRRYPTLSVLSGPANLGTVRRYLLQPEILGKANLIYGVYRLPLCREVMDKVGFPSCWGSDMAFVLGAVARAGIHIDPRVLFQKRLDLARETVDTHSHSDRLPLGHGIFPLEHYHAYAAGLIAAVRGTGFELPTRIFMEYRYRHLLLQMGTRRLFSRDGAQ